MKILFVCDFFPPFVKGGGEISAYWQAKKLFQKGINIVVLAPKYKDRLKIKKDSFEKHWYKLPFKLNNASPIIFLNPFFFVFLFLQIIKVAKKEKISLIHCQGKYSAPAAVIAKVFLKIPLILTLRDYKGICSHGFCLYRNRKSCNLISFFKKDLLFYYRYYIRNKNPFSFLFQLLVSYVGRLNTFILSFFMKKADKFVCVSDYIGQVYVGNGYDNKKMITIYNVTPKIKIETIKTSLDIEQKINEFENVFLYAGKLSLGKGADLLIVAAKEIIEKRKDVLFVFCGRINYPIQKIKSTQMIFLNKIEHELLLKIMSLAGVVCIPSSWPEPLSRVILEAFMLKKPVLSSNVGGQRELISPQRGWLFKPKKEKLIEVFDKVLQNKKQWSTLGENGYKFLRDLEKKQISKLILLYKQLR